MDIIKELPTDLNRSWWIEMGKQRKDWYMLVVLDTISGLEYPAFVRQFDEPKKTYYKFHNQNDQVVLSVYQLA